MTTNSEFMQYLEYALWNNRISEEKRKQIIGSMYNLLDMYSVDEIARIYEEDRKKYGDK